MFINSLVDYTPDCQRSGPEFEPRIGHYIYLYIFSITTH
jgi:hypothetical protein